MALHTFLPNNTLYNLSYRYYIKNMKKYEINTQIEVISIFG